MNSYIPKRVGKMKEYVPDTSEPRIKLDANESPYATPKSVLEAMKNALDLENINRYPDPDMKELLARIRAMLRVKEAVTGSILEIADLSVDTTSREVKRGNRTIDLSSKEYSVLEYLMRNKGIVVSKKKIEENICNYDYDGTSDVIKVYIHYLRRKIDDGYEKKLLHTVKNMGYVIKEE